MGWSIWVADDPELERDDLCSLLWAYPHFTISNGGLMDLEQEMGAQGMTQHGRLPSTAAEIESALRSARPEPLVMTDKDGREVWASWLEFLRAAMDHGGIVVT